MLYVRMLLLAAVVSVTVTLGSAAHAAGTPITTCGQTVTTSAFLTHDLVCTGDGIVVGADGITVDLKGFTVQGDRDSGDYGIDDSGGFDTLTVKNGVVRDFDFGLYAAIASKITVSGLKALDNLGNGISVQGDDASVSKSMAAGNGYGIALVGDGEKVTSSTASQNTVTGIFISGNGGSVKSSLAAGNVTAGVGITGGSASVTSVTAYGNGFGVRVLGDFDTVKSVTAQGNGLYGIEAVGFSDAVTSSTASGGGGPGIHVSGDVATIAHNRAELNGFDTNGTATTGFGILAENFTTPPAGTNTADANADPAECAPASLC
jgi:hypothetical protein